MEREKMNFRPPIWCNSRDFDGQDDDYVHAGSTAQREFEQDRIVRERNDRKRSEAVETFFKRQKFDEIFVITDAHPTGFQPLPVAPGRIPGIGQDM